MSACRSCGAEVRWVRTEANKLMPIDPEPRPDGNVELAGTVAIVHPHGYQHLLPVDLFVSHFATCPQAEEWRRENMPEAVRIDGETIGEDPGAPARLTGQLARVFEVLAPGAWWSLELLADAVGGSEAAMSARLRDLRKAENGGHRVERRLAGPGLWAYRLVVSERAR